MNEELQIYTPGGFEGQLSIDTGYNCPYKQSSCSLKNLHFAMDTGHVDNFGFEQADNFAKEARNALQLFNSLSLANDDATAIRKLTSHPVKKLFFQRT
ncbi:hypothetical protein TNCV_3599641 [Trichonephila clavipes]|nr:hypothetical protein TNCV_3599641 [Trichonephila clavipes]